MEELKKEIELLKMKHDLHKELVEDILHSIYSSAEEKNKYRKLWNEINAIKN